MVRGADTVGTIALLDREKIMPARVRDSEFAAGSQRLPMNFPDVHKMVTLDRFPTTLPAWVSLDIDPTRRLWIGRPNLAGELAAWDVVIGSKLIAHLTLPYPASENRYKGPLVAINRSYVAVLHEHPDAAPWIGIYKAAMP